MKKVYIIDDDRQIVDSLTMVLSSKGYKVESQFTETNVVANVKKAKPDAIILDVMFPENDSAGFQIARELKDDSATTKIPILMLSAINEKGTYVGTFSNKDKDESYLPVNEFIEKPIEPKELLHKVERLIGTKK